MLDVVKADVASKKSFNFYSYYVDYIVSVVDKSVQSEVKSMNSATTTDVDYILSKIQEELNT